ncbi:hypothetical protein NX722_15855 [Endozoicomonas gorgoniicola]|uniref:Peptidase C58 YopT-type domain-containing protein n=1 Tax=Endozoicomonas gorgoniicola TaxID=1234144 RepID=A0ABT3MXH0_9GAMM|nr:hypothetical protein [Endozoicomonas gorgoniicola]MCW7554064.1 hypothetical protein [Endozoicomonas gorgoniicola]
MKTKIFSTDNDLSACVIWPTVRTGNSVHVEAEWYEADAGICMGMVLVWMKKSIATKGEGIHNFDQPDLLHLMAIVHGAYRKTVIPLKELKHEIDIITRMFIIQSLTPENPKSGTGYFDPAAIVDWVLEEPGHCLFSFGAPLGSLKGRHVLGMRYENHIMEMLDPNEGLFQYSDVASFKKHMEEICYQENADCLGGEWAALKEKTATE